MIEVLSVPTRDVHEGVALGVPRAVEGEEDCWPVRECLHCAKKRADRNHRLEREPSDRAPEPRQFLRQTAGCGRVAAIIPPIGEAEQHVCSKRLHHVLPQVVAAVDKRHAVPAGGNDGHAHFLI
eukprot:4238392-Prymnesium_polylepis.3